MISQALNHRLERMTARYQELEQLLTQLDILQNLDQFKQLSKERAQLEPLVQCFAGYQNEIQQKIQAQDLMNDSDPEIQALAQAELQSLEVQLEARESELKTLLLPKDLDDDCNVFLEIRAGTGGDEAALFAGNLFKMYAYYAESQGWQFEIIHSMEGEHGGYKEIIVRIAGLGAYAQLKFESGGHRVQRVPETESQGRIHTSACTVAVLVESQEINHIDINPADLRIDTYRSSGAGGQHVNKTDSAVRITHLPTHIVVECQDERSQHKNRARAMSLLKARLLAAEKRKQKEKEAQTRRDLVGSGDRSERIRTYNFPQGRVTDHRINLTLYKLEEIVQGSLHHLIQPLIQEHQADLMAQLSEVPE